MKESVLDALCVLVTMAASHFMHPEKQAYIKILLNLFVRSSFTVYTKQKHIKVNCLHVNTHTNSKYR